MHLAIRADGGPDIGVGHLIRSSALAEEALSNGDAVTYVTTTPELVRECCPAGVETAPIPHRGNPAPFVDWIHVAEPDAVLADAYPIDTDYQRAIRELAPLVVVQDDARHAVCADVLVNGNLYAADLEYEFVDGVPRTCLGPDYLLLRRELRKLTDREPPWRERLERAIVTMGGSDVANLTATAVYAFEGFDVQVHAIVGPGVSSERERDVRDAAASASGDVPVVRNPDDLPELMFGADFAVSTAGSTVYELLVAGTPIVAVPVRDNQTLIAEALRRRDAAIVLGRDAGRDDLHGAIERYVTDSQLRMDHRDRGRTLVDGRGASRVYGETLSVVGEDTGT